MEHSKFSANNDHTRLRSHRWPTGLVCQNFCVKILLSFRNAQIAPARNSEKRQLVAVIYDFSFLEPSAINESTLSVVSESCFSEYAETILQVEYTDYFYRMSKLCCFSRNLRRKYTFKMRPRISIRGCVHLSVRPLVFFEHGKKQKKINKKLKKV